MLKNITSSVKNSFIYGLGNMAVKLVGFILIPIFTDPAYFSINEFGTMGILDISSQVMLAFIGLALPQSLTRWYWDKDHKSGKKELYFTTMVFQTGVSAIAILLFIPTAGFLSGVLFQTQQWETAIKLVVISASLQAINASIITLLKLQSKATLFSVSNIFKLLAVLGATLYFVVVRKMGLEGIYLAQVLGNGLFILIMLGYIRKNSKFTMNFSVLKPMLGYGLPLLIAGISNIFLSVIDRYSLNYLSVMKNVALYTLAFKVASLVRFIVVESIKMAIAPVLLKRMDNPDNDRFFSKVMIYTSFIVMYCIVGLSLFSQELIKLVTKSAEYWESISLVPILAIALFFANLKEINMYGLIFTKKTRVIGLLTFLAGALNLGLNMWLIPRYQTHGAAAATLMAQIVFWAFVFLTAQKFYPIRFDLKRVLLVFIIGSIYISALYILKNETIGIRILVKSILVLSYPFTFLLFNFYEQVELDAMKGFFRTWIRLKDFGKNIRKMGDSSGEEE